VRYRLFDQTLDVPGDILECGVFRKAGLMYWAKLLEIFCPNSTKRVIGFDAFRPFSELSLRQEERVTADSHDEVVRGVGKAAVAAAVDAAGMSNRVELVEGEIENTAAEYTQRNIGARVSLLHLDLDTYSGTKSALLYFYPIVSRGGVIILDEYGLAEVGETDAVDEFFARTDIRVMAVPYSEAPTAYVIKP
jgi:hypothetical protein